MQKKVGKRHTRLESYEEKKELVSQFNLTSDIFFSKVMEDIMACEEVIRIFTGEKFIVKKVKTQYSIRNMKSHSVVLDVLAENENGGLVSIEIHPQENEDHVRRVRYNLSCIDTSFFEKGEEYKDVPETYMLHITEKDFIGKNKGINVVNRTICGETMTLENGVHEIYVILKGETEDPGQKELLKYFLKSDSNYETEAFPNLVARVKLFKEQKEGIDIMCEIIERERMEARKEGEIKGNVAQIRKKFLKRNTPKQAADALELDLSYIENVMFMIEEGQTDEEIVMDLIKKEI